MTTHIINIAAGTMFLAAICFCTSCISYAPGDRFYRTLWESSEAPTDGMTLEFLCGNQIIAKAKAKASVPALGTYDPIGNTAYFSGLDIAFEDRVLIIEEACRNDDRLLISWHYSNGNESFSTQMHRLQPYK